MLSTKVRGHSLSLIQKKHILPTQSIRTRLKWPKGTYVENKNKAFATSGEAVQHIAPFAAVDFMQAAPHILKPIQRLHELEVLAGEILLNPCHFLPTHILSNWQ